MKYSIYNYKVNGLYYSFFRQIKMLTQKYNIFNIVLKFTPNKIVINLTVL